MNKYNSDKIANVNSLKTNAGNDAPNQFEIRQGDLVIFQSYNSIIAIADYSNYTLTFGADYKYSRTTSKYLYQFLQSLSIDIGSRKELEITINDKEYLGRFFSWTIQVDMDL